MEVELSAHLWVRYIHPVCVCNPVCVTLSVSSCLCNYLYRTKCEVFYSMWSYPFHGSVTKIALLPLYLPSPVFTILHLSSLSSIIWFEQDQAYWSILWSMRQKPCSLGISRIIIISHLSLISVDKVSNKKKIITMSYHIQSYPAILRHILC